MSIKDYVAQNPFTEIWENFLKYPELLMLTDEQVLRDAIARGIKDGVFGMEIGETVRIMEPVSPNEIEEDTSVLRKETALQLKKPKKFKQQLPR